MIWARVYYLYSTAPDEIRQRLAVLEQFETKTASSPNNSEEAHTWETLVTSQAGFSRVTS